ncbi:DNA primase [Roseovarius sp. SCSIO 43702]|uniref:DNA primase n=1 Tax=Roseovarius sp. SCSIO 43702 TaxID=2823043 RepID=UPI001C731934|nr:DNA primase [Roseovarius sp. SCSIO 43702]QYX58150.1 DNA primase [Roseovarius sp. SCSIO 43702]
MSLPPGFLDELRTRTSIAQVVGRKVSWDARKSNQGKGDMWAPCPFHQEKTASFHVDDKKGYYYCFGCHAKGDAISFVRETENVEFMEAVRILAQEVGMPIPERDPRAQEKADRISDLTEVMEAAVRFFRMSLRAAAGAEARAYLERRGLSEATQDTFEIGFAPPGWQGLWDHLSEKGVAPDRILDCGLARESQKGGKPYDVFRNRIMFPIRDPRGRCIAFGGRAMDPEDNAKYLNSPETALFDKSRVLYNLGRAREAAGRGEALVVAEGYMDVIAMAQAGIGAAVAPLGTAVTGEQLGLLWRVADEPVMALDGDRAGVQAAYRVIDTALPMIEAGKSLRFALMPEGQDPDDLIRASGVAALRERIEGALPMVELLWQRETEGRSFDSPERKAALDQALREVIGRIRDPSIRGHYGQAIRELRWQLFAPKRAARSGGGRWQPPQAPRPGTKASALAAADTATQERLREAVILAALAATPEVAVEFDGALERLDCRDGLHARLRDVILRHAGDGPDALREKAEAAIGREALENLMRLPHVALNPAIRRPGDPDLARMTVAEELAKISALKGIAEEISDAIEDLGGVADEALTWRLGQAAEARNRALRSQQEDKTEYDTADNGARINRDERHAFDALLDRITFSKPRR